MTRDSLIKLIAVVVMIVCLIASGFLSTELTASAGRNKLSYTDLAEEGDPPQVALGIAMGAFRGLFVNLLWIRANTLKEQGRYYEAYQLSDAITKLQPRFPQVWSFHAWNMAYNISVSTQTAEERWGWVEDGIRLLRDEGIPNNPNAMLLYKELAWIYLHKIQGVSDDANPFYKRQVAREWMTILGPPPPHDPMDRSREHAIEKYVQWLTPIAEAPDTLESLIEKDPKVGELVDRLRKEARVEPGLMLLRKIVLIDALSASGQWAAISSRMAETDRAFKRLREDESLADAWDALAAQVRRRVLIDQYNMEPLRMVQYTRLYGPIDWRNPAAHALYWSARGVEQALGRVSSATEKDFDFVNTDRITIQAVQELYRTGEVYYDVLNDQYIVMPDAFFVQTYGDILGSLIDRSWVDRMHKEGDKEGKVFSFYAAGYENFLSDVIRFFYRRGQIEEAQKWYHVLGTYPGQNLNDASRAERMSKPLEEFIQEELIDRYTTPNVARDEVVGALQGAYISGLLAGDGELFISQFNYARKAHAYFFKEQGHLNPITGGETRMEPMPRDFRVLAGGVFAQLMSFMSIENAQRMYDGAPDDLKRFAYDIMAQRFKKPLEALAEQGGEPFEVMFPEPSGMDEHRATMNRLLQNQKRQINVKPQ
jgi:hypothetical protein